MCGIVGLYLKTPALEPELGRLTALMLHEMAARGIPVAIASDNTRDPFHAYGDLDLMEVYREGTRLLHLDHPVGEWPATVAAGAARAGTGCSTRCARRGGEPDGAGGGEDRAGAGRDLRDRGDGRQHPRQPQPHYARG